MPANNKQTTLDLNGPILSFVTQPTSSSFCGVATFVGVATATFPIQTPSNLAIPTGYISYKWYTVDNQSSTIELSDGLFRGATIAGSATTTLTITAPIYLNNYKFFLKADYVPSAYSVSGFDVIAGTARSTGNAINDPKDSNTVTLIANPEITITQQPKSAKFETSTALVRIIDDLGNQISISPKEIPFYNDFSPGKIYTIISNSDVKVDITASGAGGGSSYYQYVVPGGNGGLSSGTLTLLADKEYKIVVGGAGGSLNENDPGYGGGGSNNQGGGGGGYTGIFSSSISQSNAIIIAGGGGGGGNFQQNTGLVGGGDGGGLVAGDSPGSGNRGGKGGTQSSGGIGGKFDASAGTAGGALQGGSGAGGGGGGYYGGGGGQIVYDSTFGFPVAGDGGGGGGSGYLHPTLVTNGSTEIGKGAFAGTDGSITLDFEPTISTAQEFEATFSVDAQVDDDSEDKILYQWQLNEVDLVDGITKTSIPKNNYDYPTNALLRLPLWDKNSDSNLDLIDLTNVPNTVSNTNVSWVIGGGKFYNGYASFQENSFLEITPSSDFNFGIGDFTVESWVYFTQTGYNDIFSTGSYGQNQLSIRKNASSQLSASPGTEQLEVYYNATIIASGGKFNLNTWHHVAVSRKEGFIRLFIDGKQVASSNWNGNISASSVKIGRTTDNLYNMVGRMQDFQVYGIAKYTSDFIAPVVGIVDKKFILNFPLWDEGTGTLKLTDLSSNKKTITDGSTYGKSPLWNKGVGKFYGGAAYFNGNHYLGVNGSEDFNFGTEDFTIELWCRFSTWTTNTYEVLVNVGGGYYGDGGTWFSLLRNSTGGAEFYLADRVGYREIGTVSDLKVGTWRHLAVSKSSASVKFYIDGKLVNSTNVSSWTNGNFGGNALGYIGLERATFNTVGSYYPQCYMQDLKIYKGLNKYTADFTPEESSSVFLQSEYIDKTTIVSGAKTKNLTISTQDVSNNLLRCKISHPTACNSLLYSNSVGFNVTSIYDRALIGMEVYYDNAATGLKDVDIKNYSHSISNDIDGYISNTNIISSDTICLYAKERDIYVEVEMYGSSGENKPSYNGGNGGYSKIRFLMKKDDEYILRGIRSRGALWLYRKAQLIACVGQGGSAGKAGAGGRGGGVGVNGENAENGGGNGGSAIQSGQLTGNGTFGSLSSASFIYSEDTKATGNLGGKTISCTKGIYWKKEGKSACEDLGKIKFRLSSGTEVSNSAQINRGYKDGYAINQTAGKSDSSDNGIGGNGATGGNGNSGTYTNRGGGGGSGYNDGSIKVMETTLGGNNSMYTLFVIRYISETPNDFGDFYQDSAGRILIFSAATVGKDPRTLTKVTGKVLPGTDTCIDDARWQRFLELAATQDYRLTSTLDGKTTSITKAEPFNIRRMLNANYVKLKTSLTDWQLIQYTYPLYCLSWDENYIDPGYGSDYSILSWGGTTYYYGYYGQSFNSFFSQTTYNNTTANFWILPPGVPDF